MPIKTDPEHKEAEQQSEAADATKDNTEVTCDTIEHSIVAIETLDRAGCLNRWRDVFGRPPPKHLSTKFIKRVLIWQVQTRMQGGVSKATERRLQQIADGKTQRPRARPGTHLVREWNGRTYQVEVVEDGYRMDGRTWRSLSAIACHITGAHWSGPRFFGVR